MSPPRSQLSREPWLALWCCSVLLVVHGNAGASEDVSKKCFGVIENSCWQNLTKKTEGSCSACALALTEQPAFHYCRDAYFNGNMCSRASTEWTAAVLRQKQQDAEQKQHKAASTPEAAAALCRREITRRCWKDLPSEWISVQTCSRCATALARRPAFRACRAQVQDELCTTIASQRYAKRPAVEASPTASAAGPESAGAGAVKFRGKIDSRCEGVTVVVVFGTSGCSCMLSPLTCN